MQRYKHYNLNRVGEGQKKLEILWLVFILLKQCVNILIIIMLKPCVWFLNVKYDCFKIDSTGGIDLSSSMI